MFLLRTSKNFPRSFDWFCKTTPRGSRRFHHTTRPNSNIIKNFFAQPDIPKEAIPKPQPAQIPPDLPDIKTTENNEEFLPFIELDNTTTRAPEDRFDTFTESFEEERVEDQLGNLAGPRAGEQLGEMGGLLNKDGHFRHSYSTGVDQPAVEYFRSSKKLRRTLEEDEDEPFLTGENAEDVLFYYEEDIEETNIYPAKSLEGVKVERAGDVGGEKGIEPVRKPGSLTNVVV